MNLVSEGGNQRYTKHYTWTLNFGLHICEVASIYNISAEENRSSPRRVVVGSCGNVKVNGDHKEVE